MSLEKHTLSKKAVLPGFVILALGFALFNDQTRENEHIVKEESIAFQAYGTDIEIPNKEDVEKKEVILKTKKEVSSETETKIQTKQEIVPETPIEEIRNTIWYLCKRDNNKKEEIFNQQELFGNWKTGEKGIFNDDKFFEDPKDLNCKIVYEKVERYKEGVLTPQELIDYYKLTGNLGKALAEASITELNCGDAECSEDTVDVLKEIMDLHNHKPEFDSCENKLKQDDASAEIVQKVLEHNSKNTENLKSITLKFRNNMCSPNGLTWTPIIKKSKDYATDHFGSDDPKYIFHQQYHQFNHNRFLRHYDEEMVDKSFDEDLLNKYKSNKK